MAKFAGVWKYLHFVSNRLLVWFREYHLYDFSSFKFAETEDQRYGLGE